MAAAQADRCSDERARVPGRVVRRGRAGLECRRVARFARLKRRARLIPTCSSPPSLVLRARVAPRSPMSGASLLATGALIVATGPRAAARSSMSGVSWPAREADAGGRGGSSSPLRQCGLPHERLAVRAVRSGELELITFQIMFRVVQNGSVTVSPMTRTLTMASVMSNSGDRRRAGATE